eukprot:TRINITY_DN2332_c1_g1_i3.p2 TRINITY_DN2332_c1_g1~~TRINITY_DN2332_c1_g1_i3.p2  ORF type:complete len:467 (-),score=70.60 TRINITY_DN2332_c1_g1_i3:115-1455(-)
MEEVSVVHSAVKHCERPCSEVLHPFLPGCTYGVMFGKSGFVSSLQIYAPTLLASALLSGRITSARFWVTKLIPSVVRSSAMIGTFGFIWGDLACRLSKLSGRHTSLNYALVPFVASVVSLLVEQQKRRSEMTVFVWNNALDCAYRMLVSRKLLPPVKHGLTLLFAVGMAALHYFQKRDQSLLGSSECTFMSAIVGREGHPDAFDKIVLRRSAAVAPLLSSPTGDERDEESYEPKPKHRRLCLHEGSCVSYCAAGAARGAVIGFSVKCILVLAPMLMSGRIDTVKLMRKSPAKFAAFLALLSAGTRGTQCWLRSVREVEDGWNQALSGFFGGLSFALCGSVEISMYLVSKAADVVYKFLKQKGFVTPIPGGQTLMFATGTSLLFWAMFWEPHNLRPSYITYLNTASSKTLCKLLQASHEVRMEHMSGPNLRRYLKWFDRGFRKLSSS